MKTTTTAAKTRKRKLDLSPEKQAAAKERREGLRKIATSIREMGTENIEAEADKFGIIPSITGRDLSAFNSVFVRRQLATAKQVGGFQQWKKAGRKVKKGSKAIAIWLPVSKKEEQEDGTEKEELNFRIVNVFDISQTEEI